MKIEVGQIYRVVTDHFFTTEELGINSKKFKRPVNILCDEKIEIRYPYAWHFRTEDGNYYHATEEMIQKNCILFGKILEDVRFGNRCSLEEILRLRLYK